MRKNTEGFGGIEGDIRGFGVIEGDRDLYSSRVKR